MNPSDKDIKILPKAEAMKYPHINGVYAECSARIKKHGARRCSCPYCKRTFRPGGISELRTHLNGRGGMNPSDLACNQRKDEEPAVEGKWPKAKKEPIYLN